VLCRVFFGELRKFCSGFARSRFDVPADSQYGGIRAELEAAGKPIGPNDFLIAARALALGVALVTANTGECHGLIIPDSFMLSYLVVVVNQFVLCR